MMGTGLMLVCSESRLTVFGKNMQSSYSLGYWRLPFEILTIQYRMFQRLRSAHGRLLVRNISSTYSHDWEVSSLVLSERGLYHLPRNSLYRSCFCKVRTFVSLSANVLLEQGRAVIVTRTILGAACQQL